MRTWGGVVGIHPRHRLIDGTETTQPEYSFWFSDAGWGVENYGTDPTHEVDIAPQDTRRGVDPQMEEALRLVGEALRALAATGTALLVAEHKTNLLDGLCGRVAVVVDGRIVLDGPASTVLCDERLEGWGVEPPSRIRLSRALAGTGVNVAAALAR